MASKKSVAWIFGYSRQTKMIADALREDKFKLHIVESNQKYHQDALDDGIESYLMDITEDDELEKLAISPNDYLICIMEDEHLNVFLTLSLRSLFPKNQIISVSHSIYATQKLKMAGADKIIDTYQVSANRIHNIFNKPIATKLLDNFLSSNHDISFREFKIPKHSILDGVIIDSVDFNAYGVIMVGMLDMELGDKFIFATANISHKIDFNDIIICLGKDEDLDKFGTMLHQEKR